MYIGVSRFEMTAMLVVLGAAWIAPHSGAETPTCPFPEPFCNPRDGGPIIVTSRCVLLHTSSSLSTDSLFLIKKQGSFRFRRESEGLGGWLAAVSG